jgi:DOMON domain
MRLSTLLLWLGAFQQVFCWRSAAAIDSQWMHSMQLDSNYDVFWSVNDQEVTFEVHVATLGYVIFGISTNGQFQDADLVVGWVQNGRPRFQVSHSIHSIHPRHR